MVSSQEHILNTPFTVEFVLEQVKSSRENGEALAHQLLGYEVHVSHTRYYFGLVAPSDRVMKPEKSFFKKDPTKVFLCGESIPGA
jgi:hypothetical protein